MYVCMYHNSDLQGNIHFHSLKNFIMGYVSTATAVAVEAWAHRLLLPDLHRYRHLTQNNVEQKFNKQQ